LALEFGMAKIWFGTSGFSYKEWKDRFYPAELPDKRMLPYYASRFNSVEIDSTFYRMPTAKTIESWREATPDGFRFTIKASQQITHRQRLKTPSDALEYFTNVLPGLEGRLGLALFQLPPYFKCDLPRLEAFLFALPRGFRAALEFRHDSWFTEATYDLLRKYRAALCIHDADEGATPMVLTSDATYIRLRRSVYSPEQRREWQNRLLEWAAGGAEIYAYIKHEDNPDAPAIALGFAEGLQTV
jgi:uncharacterized protein YecE (DUF72 family)